MLYSVDSWFFYSLLRPTVKNKTYLAKIIITYKEIKFLGNYSTESYDTHQTYNINIK